MNCFNPFLNLLMLSAFLWQHIPEIHSALCKETFFYLFEIDLLLFLSSTLCSCTEEFSEFSSVFVLATATLNFVNFNRISYPSPDWRVPPFLVSSCEAAALLAYHFIWSQTLSFLTCRATTQYSGYGHFPALYDTKMILAVLFSIFFLITCWLFLAAITYRTVDLRELLIKPPPLSWTAAATSEVSIYFWGIV